MDLESVFENIKQYCSDNLLEKVLYPFKGEIDQFASVWDVSNYIRTNTYGVSLMDKLNVIISFLHSGGAVLIDGNMCTRKNKPNFLFYLVSEQIVTDDEEWEANSPWIDCTDGTEPYFDIKSN